MKILILGHACGPNLGSEPGFTWNWAWHLSGVHQVWVITHPERRTEVEAYLAVHPRPNLRFVWVVPAARLDPWKPGDGERGIRFHYLLWLRIAYSRAQQLHEQIGFDIAHHVSWGTIGAAPPFHRLSIPCVWGPVGGGQTTPASFLRYFGRPWAERIRTLYVRALRFAPGLRRAAKTAKLVLATNRETAEFLTQVGAKHVKSFLDGGLPAAYVSDTPPVRSQSGTLRLLWAGRMEPRKGLRLVLEAMGRLTTEDVSLTVAGSGHLEPELKKLCVELGIAEKVHFIGSVPYTEMPALFRSCDAFVFSSLRDSFGSVVLEAMAQGMAIVMLDHQGVGTFVPSEAAFRGSGSESRRDDSKVGACN